ncbi:hypothetical protein G9406_01055 [Weissella paramesenteroides]|uniref:hypothetical protein n=1 Tax=Weissella paramesenteroides TaxID=1249 RepID=UPI0024027E45|nr:hypothetical protein [Weissella paramesenteroides]MDF8366201.1 hypothetical protein [Weissella paramesenteroides]
MLAEMVMFIQVLGMAVRASILPWIGVMCVLYLVYKYRGQIEWLIKGIMRSISWLLIVITDGKSVADEYLPERK